jgi:hypothetical protein
MKTKLRKVSPQCVDPAVSKFRRITQPNTLRFKLKNNDLHKIDNIKWLINIIQHLHHPNYRK